MFVISTINIKYFQARSIYNIGIYTSPFIFMYIYKRGFFAMEETRSLARFLGGVGCLIALSFLIRSVGRAFNPQYTAFLKALTSSNTDQKIYLEKIRKYDFEFYAWPVSFAVSPRRRLLFVFYLYSSRNKLSCLSHHGNTVTETLSLSHHINRRKW